MIFILLRLCLLFSYRVILFTHFGLSLIRSSCIHLIARVGLLYVWREDLEHSSLVV